MMRKIALIGAALLLSFAAQAVEVSWDGASTDITSLTASVNASGANWADADKAWDTSDMAIAAQGDQAAVKLAMSQMQQQHKTAQIHSGTDSLFIGGGGNTNQLSGGLPKTPITAGFSTLYAFDTGLASGTLTNLSVTVRERAATTVCSFRWFVVSGGTPYISASVSADVGSVNTTYTMADPASEVWYAFDGSVNLEAAVGASVGTLTLDNVTYAGIMATVDTPDYTQNWQGMYVYQFFAETDGVAANEPPVADAQSVFTDKNLSVDITLTGSDPEGSSLTYSVESLPANGLLTGTGTNRTYTPNIDYVGTDSFTFTVNDGETNSAPATVSIKIIFTPPGAVWDDGGTDDFWSNPTNWVGDVLPVSESNVTFNTPAVNENIVMDSDFTLGSGQTLLNNSIGGNLVFRIGDMGASGELRFATGSTLAFDDQGFITESGSVNQRLTFEPGATLSAWRYYANIGFTTTFEASETGISTFHTTDSSGGNSLRCRGALEVDLTSYTNGPAHLVLFTYTKITTDTFSSITVTDSSGTLVEGEDYGITYDANLGDGVRSVVLSIYQGGIWENDMSTDPVGDGWDIRDDRDGHYVTNGLMVMPAGVASTSTIDTMPVNTFVGITQVDLQWRATTTGEDGSGRGASLYIVVDAEGIDAGAINFHAVLTNNTQTFRIFSGGTQIDEVTGFSTNMLTLAASIDGYKDTVDYIIGDGTTSVTGSVSFVQSANTAVGSIASLLTFAPEMEVDYIRIEAEAVPDAAYVLTDPAAITLTDVSKAAVTAIALDAICNASTNVDLTITISDESHAGAFSVSNANPTVNPPNSVALGLQFDPVAGSVAYEATATGLVIIDWSEQGGGDSGQVVVPISVTVGSFPILAWDGYENLQTVQSTFNATNAAETAWNTTTASLSGYGYPTITSAFSSISDGSADHRAQYMIRGQNNPDELWIRGGGNLVSNSYVTLVGMDASSLGDPELMVDSISVEIREERAADTTKFRWFVEANGSAYVSAEVVELTTTFTNIALDNATAIEWFAFDGGTNVADAIGASVGTANLQAMAFANISAVGVYVDAAFTTVAAWHGSRIITLSVGTALDTYTVWAASHGLSGANAAKDADVEPDGLDNLMEYALGGDPTVDDAATVAPGTYMAVDGGSNWFYHVYDERTDDASLTFTVGATPNLVYIAADTNDVEFVGQTAESGGFKTVTNRTEASTDAKFIKLEVSQ